jgi:hypothetical protein
LDEVVSDLEAPKPRGFERKGKEKPAIKWAIFWKWVAF